MTARQNRRRGVVLIIVLTLIAVIALITIVLAQTLLAGRQFLDRRHHQVQAEWLARAGIERARAQKSRGDQLSKGTWQALGERGHVAIEVQTKNEGVEVTSIGTFPADELRPAVRERVWVVRKNGR